MAKYSSYHGQSKRGITLVVVLLILLILAAVVIFVLPDFMVFSEDGKLQIEIPLFKIESSPSPSPVESFEVIVETPSPSSLPSPSPSPSPSSQLQEFRAIDYQFTSNPDDWEIFKETIQLSGATSVVLPLKLENGTIVDSELLKKIITALKSDKVTFIANVSAFKDNVAPKNNGKVGVKHKSGVNWLDRTNSRWLDVHSTEAQDYLIEIILSAKDIGFDEVLLDNMHFPYVGSLSSTKVHTDKTHVQAMDEFLVKLKASIPETLKISAVLLEETIANGANEPAGQSLESFKNTFSKLYVTVPDDGVDIAQEYIPIYSTSLNLDILRDRLSASKNGWLLTDNDGIYPTGAFN